MGISFVQHAQKSKLEDTHGDRSDKPITGALHRIILSRVGRSALKWGASHGGCSTHCSKRGDVAFALIGNLHAEVASDACHLKF
jgi:hypothetical protein